MKKSWHKKRKRYLGASEVPAVIGLSEYSTPLQVYESKVNDHRIETNSAMMSGIIMEPFLAEKFQEIENEKGIKPENTYFANEFLGANLDFLTENNRVVEFKFMSRPAYEKIKSDGASLSHFAQIQYQMLCVKHHNGALVIGVDDFGLHQWPIEALKRLNKRTIRGLLINMEFSITPIEFDADFIQKSMPKLEYFWKENVEKQIPPSPVSESDFSLIHAIQGKIAYANEFVKERYSKLAELKSQIKPLEFEKKVIEKEIKILMNDSEYIQDENGTLLFSWKEDSEYSFDSKRFKEENPEIVKQYLKTEKVRRFLQKGV